MADLLARRITGAVVKSTASALGGIAGALLTTILGTGDPTAGLSYLFPAFAAVFLGATTIRPGRYNVIGTVIGVYFVGTAVSGLTLRGADTWVQPVFNGAALIFAVVPRLTVPLGWGLLAAGLVLGQFGELLRLPAWLQNLSPFRHSPALPVEDLDITAVTAALLLTGAAAILAAVAAGVLNRRDLTY